MIISQTCPQMLLHKYLLCTNVVTRRLRAQDNFISRRTARPTPSKPSPPPESQPRSPSPEYQPRSTRSRPAAAPAASSEDPPGAPVRRNPARAARPGGRATAQLMQGFQDARASHRSSADSPKPGGRMGRAQAQLPTLDEPHATCQRAKPSHIPEPSPTPKLSPHPSMDLGRAWGHQSGLTEDNDVGDSPAASMGLGRNWAQRPTLEKMHTSRPGARRSGPAPGMDLGTIYVMAGGDASDSDASDDSSTPPLGRAGARILSRPAGEARCAEDVSSGVSFLSFQPFLHFQAACLHPSHVSKTEAAAYDSEATGNGSHVAR